MSKVFLGGTCNGSFWRDELIKMLHIDYFNPVVPDWTEECMAEELRQREICDYCLYVITPSMTGVYSIAEVVDDSNKRPAKTIFCVLSCDNPRFMDGIPYYPNAKVSFSIGEMKSLTQVGKMVERNGGKYFRSLEDTAHYLNDNNKIIASKLKIQLTDPKRYPNLVIAKRFKDMTREERIEADIKDTEALDIFEDEDVLIKYEGSEWMYLAWYEYTVIEE